MAKGKKKGSHRRSSGGLGNVVALAAGAILGGIGGAVAASQGVSPGTVVTAATLAGAAGAVFGKGQVKYFALGVGAVGASQGAIQWWKKGDAERRQRQLANNQQQQPQLNNPSATRQGNGNEANPNAADELARARANAEAQRSPSYVRAA